ncbi:MAG: methyltransferase domain-containing protein [Alphaproteobacteria bacterium]|nr:methyltransferase domain-containing protein [Alphaproteobacteria bacterium]
MTTVPQIFDRRLLRMRRLRAAAGFDAFDFLALRAAEEISERLAERKEHFGTAVCCGARQPQIDARHLVSFDSVSEHLRTAPSTSRTNANEGGVRALAVIGDEERLPFAPTSLDLYASVMTLHALNDVPGALAQIRRALKPNAAFVAAMFGGETLKELREALALAEIESDGGLSPRVFPFADVRDIGNLLQRAGFAEPVVDVDTVMVHYSDPLKLLQDLRGMGESNVLVERRRSFLKRRTLGRMCEIYAEKFVSSDGRLPATFQIFHLSGRARFEPQQQPLEDGARMRLG